MTFKLTLPKTRKPQVSQIEDAEILEETSVPSSQPQDKAAPSAAPAFRTTRDRTIPAPQGDAETPAPPQEPHAVGQNSTAVAQMQDEESSVIWVQKSRDQYEFMPALLELMERPASPLGRGMVWFTCLIFASAIAWASFGKVDIVAVAPGVIQPRGGDVTLQAGMGGTVNQVLVTEGDRVSQGQTLMTFDDRETQVPLEQVEERLRRLTVQAHISARVLKHLGTPTQFSLQAYRIPLTLLRLARKQADARYSAYLADMSTLDAEVAELRGRLASTQASIYAQEASLPTYRDHVENMVGLMKRNLVRSNEALELQIILEDREDALRADRVALDDMIARLETLAARRDAREATERFAAIDALMQAEQDGSIALLELERLVTASERLVMTAPQDGVISQVAITPGATIPQAGVHVMTFLPDDTLEVEALLPARDIGFVDLGMDVAVKVGAYPFTRFGHIDGRIIHISPDSIRNDASFGQPVYKVTVELDSDHLSLEDQTYPIGPGMEVTADVRTGERTILDYFLSPVTASVVETLRER